MNKQGIRDPSQDPERRKEIPPRCVECGGTQHAIFMRMVFGQWKHFCSDTCWTRFKNREFGK